MSLPTRTVTLFLAGDVMTGRGIDQILPRPGDPRLLERYVRSASEYVALAERENGPLPRPAGFPYIWGDALAELARMNPQARIVNLETAVTTSDDAWPGKGIHYRMNPANVECLTAAALDCCVLANNHVMDWGRSGLAGMLIDGGVDAVHGHSSHHPKEIEIHRGRLLEFALSPMRLRRMRLERAAREDAAWLGVTLGKLGSPLELRGDGTFSLRLR